MRSDWRTIANDHETWVGADHPREDGVGGNVMGGSIEITPELLAGFLDEAPEYLVTLDGGLLEFESKTGSGVLALDTPAHMELMNNMFRAAHSLKGLAATFGYEKIQKLTHRMETLFDQVRMRKRALSSESFELLFRVFDRLRLLVGELSDPAITPIGIDDILTGLDQALNDGGPTPVADQPVEPGETTCSRELMDEPFHDSQNKVDQVSAKASETLRIDQKRLDELMRLSGELAINRSRFAQVQGQFKEVFEDRDLGCVVDEMADSISRIAESLTTLREDRGGCREIDDVGMNLLHLHENFHSVRSLLGQVQGLRNSMPDFDEALHELTRVSQRIQKGIRGARMVPIGPMFTRLRRVVRDVCKITGKEVELQLRGETTELDKRMVDELADPLTHMVRNSVDHGIETPQMRRAAGKNSIGTLTLEASHRGNTIWVEVTDDGGGINLEKVKKRAIERGLTTPTQIEGRSDREIIRFILQPGFSTADTVTEISGRGVGMDIVKTKIEQLAGTLEINSTPGQGTQMVILLPLAPATWSSATVASPQ